MLKIGKKMTIKDRYGKSTYRWSIDEPEPNYIPIDERGYGDREPGPVITRKPRNRNELCSHGDEETCYRCPK